MNLKSLAVDPNPFEDNPYAKPEPSKKRWFGPIDRRHMVVPLMELALRVLLAPSSELYGHHEPLAAASRNKRQETVLEHYYDLPLQSDYVKSPLLRETLSSCVPGSIAATQTPHAPPSSSPEARRSNHASRQHPCVSICPSPRHLDLVAGEFRRPVFVTHCEERISWEKGIAGQPAGGETGIPVRWRGCSAGCLEYLDQPSSQNSVSTVGGIEEDWSVGMDVDKDKIDADGSPVRFAVEGTFKAFDSADIDLED